MDFEKFYELGLTDSEVSQIDEIYDYSIIYEFINNLKSVKENVELLKKYGLDELIIDIIIRFLPIFLYYKDELEIKLKYLIEKIGENYIDAINNDINILEELL